mmetsp:Transcript_7688/g.14559  ORF Transcript_7688/g.14559 Transcript_7688/m.14559 type:complete len:239 (-) Transcript_7688:4209-4925(-)
MASPIKNRSLLLDISYTKTTKAPHKYDHFHNKTFIETFIPTFQSNYFTNVLRRGEKPYELPPSKGRFQVLPIRPIYGVRRNLSEEPKPKRVWRPKPPPLKKFPEVHQHQLPVLSTDFDDIPDPEDIGSVNRKVLCVKDGSFMDVDDFRFYEVDIRDFKWRFVGKKTPKKIDEFDDPLLRQGLSELFEIVNLGLKSNEPFTHIFTLEGVPVPNILRVPEGTRVLLFSTTGSFRGLQMSK